MLWTRLGAAGVIDTMGSEGRGDRVALPLFDLELLIVLGVMAALGLLC